MATPMPHTGPVGPDTLITVKIFINGQNRRFKLALRDLGAHVLPQKLRFLLQIPATTEVKFDRFSDSAGTYVTLDSANPAVYKQLYRAAKAKLKLRLKATIIAPEKPVEAVEPKDDPQAIEPKFADYRGNNFFDTVLAKPTGELRSAQEPKPAQTESMRQMTEKVAQLPLSRPTLPTLNDFSGTTFSIDCNRCGESVSNEHYHCGKCEMGDFDLCPSCIERGVTCDGDDHWLIKRTIKGGRVYASNTETLPPKPKTPPAPAPAPALAPQPIIEGDQRSCNSCIIQLAAASFVTCQQCPDYDLCFFCLEQGQHGHHPAHTFTPVDATSPSVSPYIKTLCQQGRGLRHEAVCDGCEAQIVGVRHKCLTCPDFDYCSTCIQVAPEVHPSHRFAPIYEQLAAVSGKKEQHRGVHCDGPLCAPRTKNTYIRGDRYKCAICPDTDFCANCEALPSNPHNRTHPLIKLKTPVRQLSIATVQQHNNGEAASLLGDHPAAKHAATETTRATSANAATQVQTVAETAPVESKSTVLETAPADPLAPLEAHFESESTPDGTTFLPDHLISQSWTLRNVGPTTWPAGCAVHFIGGDDMRNLDDKHPSPVSSMILANRSSTCTEPVEPGKSHTFTVTLKSPAREGRAISYWRLKTVDGLPFGHKLWCDINVSGKAIKPVEAPAVVPVEAPAEQQESAVDADQDEASSQMIFPKLEKESPASSINDVKQEPIAAEPNVTADEQDLIDDLDSMALDDESTEDDFMTDEEYDILDAEEEEYLVNAQRAVRH